MKIGLFGKKKNENKNSDKQESIIAEVEEKDNSDDPFQWKDDYCIGVEEIDQAHMKLFIIIRRLTKNLSNDNYHKNRRTCVEVVKYLKQYSLEHFAQEEAYQLKIGYGGYVNHKRIHDHMRDVTIPALERKMELSDYSEDSVNHFAGVCAAWLTAHVMLEDQAIAGKIKSQWEESLDTSAVDILCNHAETFMSQLFNVTIQPENLSYDGYNIGDCFFYYMIYKSSSNNIYRTAVALNKKLVLKTLGQIMNRELTFLDDMAMSMMQELSQTFAEDFLAKYAKENISCIGEGLVDKDAFYNDFKVNHPDLSMLWNTNMGHISFCLKTIKPKITA